MVHKWDEPVAAGRGWRQPLSSSHRNQHPDELGGNGLRARLVVACTKVEGGKAAPAACSILLHPGAFERAAACVCRGGRGGNSNSKSPETNVSFSSKWQQHLMKLQRRYRYSSSFSFVGCYVAVLGTDVRRQRAASSSSSSDGKQTHAAAARSSSSSKQASQEERASTASLCTIITHQRCRSPFSKMHCREGCEL